MRLGLMVVSFSIPLPLLLFWLLLLSAAISLALVLILPAFTLHSLHLSSIDVCLLV
jgi:hypothetical protein